MTVQRIADCYKYNPISAISAFVQYSPLGAKVATLAAGILLATVVFIKKTYSPLFLAKFTPLQAALGAGIGYWVSLALAVGMVYIYFRNNPPR